jgi:monoamine oxidase
VSAAALSTQISVVERSSRWAVSGSVPPKNRLAALASELDVRTFPTHTEGDNLLRIDGRRRAYSGTIPRMNPIALVEVSRTLRRLNRLSRDVDPEAPWNGPDARRLDSMSLAAWLGKTLRTSLGRRLMRVAVCTIWGAEPEELSLLHAAFYVRSGGSFELLADVEGGAQQERFFGGSQLIAIRAAEALGGRVQPNAAARRIDHGPHGVLVRAGGFEARAKRAIIAIPPPLVSGIEFNPPLPGERQQLAYRMTPGRLTKVTAVYGSPFWREKGLSGEAINEEGPVTMTFDNSPPGGARGALVGFIGGRDASRYARLATSERRHTALGCFESLYGPEARAAELYLEQDWAAEPWSAGGPVCNFATGGWTASGPALRKPVGPLHWAGTETATRWNGYMDGAVRSGERAAEEALQSLSEGAKAPDAAHFAPN